MLCIHVLGALYVKNLCMYQVHLCQTPLRKVCTCSQWFVMLIDFYCGMYIPLSDDKHRKVRNSSKSALEIQDKFSPRQNRSENFFQWLEKKILD